MHSLSIVLRMIIGLMFAMILLTAPSVKAATLDSHDVMLDNSGKIIPWTTDPTQGYDQVINLAWNYLLTGVPSDSQNGQPYYYSYSYINPNTQQAVSWPHNPAGLYSMLTESALKYYGYSGNIEVVKLAENVAAAQLNKGMTPSGWNWANVPYASGDAGSLTYQGAAYGDTTGRGDGTGVIEPDKVGEMGYAWLQLYRFNGNTIFLDTAIAAADALASHVRIGNATQSPWPFRVYAQTGVVREDYCADVIGPISLLDGLISLGLGNTAAYQTARQTAWNWLMTYPMQNDIWANYFEDIWITADTSNVNQYNAMMTARYLLEHPELDPSWESHVRGLINWVEANFAVPAYGANSIAEQMQFWYPMGSHTSRYASVNALLYEKTGDAVAKEKAYLALNWATYMTRSNGVVIDGPEVNNQWFTDGYGDYIRHFMTSLGAVPEWAPTGQNHIVRSSSIVKNVNYLPNGVSYTTSDGVSTEVLRTNFTPASVTVDGQTLSRRSDLNQAGWTFDPGLNVLRVRHDAGTNVQIASGTLLSIALTPANQSIQTGTVLQFIATGTLSDGSVQNITSQTTWTSSNSSVATINSAGIVTAISTGSTIISAAQSGITGSTSLAVQSAPLTATTASLPGGTLNISYMASLAASGGTPPYSWSLVGGSLPTGLSLNNTTGVISGTPTAGGTSSFTVQASDTGNLQQTATRALSITVAAPANFAIWPVSTLPVIADSGPDSAVELGVKFRADSSGYITGIRFYKAAANSGTHIGNLWTDTGTLLATATFTGETTSGWQQVNFPTPVAITANTVYVASYHTSTGHYSFGQNYFATSGVDSPPLHALAAGVSGVNGVYAYGSNSSFPDLGWRSSNYWVDVAFSTTTTPDTSPPMVTAFTVPASTTSLTVPIMSFTALDNVTVTGYQITATGIPPAPTAGGWSGVPPTSYSFTTAGIKTLYAWAKDAAGNVSAGVSAVVAIAFDTTPPTVTVFTIPASAASLTIPISSLIATDNVMVTGYQVTESFISPAAAAGGWSATPPLSYTFTTAGAKILYAWAKDAAGNVSASWSDSVTVTLTDTTPPSAPANLTAVVSGPTQVNLNWTTSTDNLGVVGYRVIRNGSQIVTSGSTGYSDTTVIPVTTYSYTVRAFDAAGNVSGDSNTASVTTPAGSLPPLLDVTVTTKQSTASSTISSPGFSTAKANELLVAFIASDGPNTGGSQRITAVTGGGLAWTLHARANTQAGTAEIWQASATNVVTNVTVTATRAAGSYQGMITVAAFQGASLVASGAAANASAASGAPTVSLVTTRANSVVWGVGDDWDRALARTVSPNQTMLSEYLAPTGDTFWVQYINAPVAMAGVTATISCTAPTNDRWNLVAVEIVPQ